MRSKFTNILLEETGVLKSTIISKKEAKDYPEQRIRRTTDFNYLIEDKPDKDIELSLLAKQTLYLRTIKNILLFFFILSIASGIIGLMYIIFSF